MPTLRVLAAVLRIDPNNPAEADDVAALADLLVRRELRALRDDLPPPPAPYSRRPHVARERLRARLRAEQGDGPLIGPGDSLGDAIAANLAELARRSRG